MNLKLLAFVTSALALCVISRASAQVRGYTVGIDVNCPSGLGE